SQARFVDLLSRVMREFEPLQIQLDSSRAIIGVARAHSFGLRSISLCPFGLYAHPCGNGEIGTTVKDILSRLKTTSTISFEWNVRFDHESLAQPLARLGVKSTRTVTHVLPISSDYEATFAAYDSTARNLVRRARREGLVIRLSDRPGDVNAYYDIHL